MGSMSQIFLKSAMISTDFPFRSDLPSAKSVSSPWVAYLLSAYLDGGQDGGMQFTKGVQEEYGSEI